MYSMFLAKLGQAYKPEKIRGMLKLFNISSCTETRVAQMVDLVL